MKPMDPLAALGSGAGMRLPYATALSRSLPSREHSLLLAACLLDGANARRAWHEFVAHIGDAKSYFEDNHTGLKGLLPFVESSLIANGIDAGRVFHTYARVALVREELRSRILAEILEETVAAADARGIPLVLLKGAAVSATAYPEPSRRHIHAIDLLIESGHWPAASALLSQLRFTAVTQRQPGAAFHRNFRHVTGLALGLHDRAFFLPYFDLPPQARGATVRRIALGAGTVRVLSPEANIVHIGGHALYSRHHANLRWVCDLVLLLRSDPDLDWRAVTEIASGAGLAVALLTQLRWLNEMLCPVPAHCLAALAARSQELAGQNDEGIYASLLHATQSRRQTFGAFAGDWRGQLGFLRFSAWPSTRYMRWKHNVDSRWRLAMHYADRPRRLAARIAPVRGT